MGVRITSKNKSVAKVLSALATFQFEQEFNELRRWSAEDKEVLRKAIAVFSKYA